MPTSVVVIVPGPVPDIVVLRSGSVRTRLLAEQHEADQADDKRTDQI